MLKIFVLLLFPVAAGVAAQRVTEVPSGLINSTNASFTLSTVPYPDTVKVHKNGVRLTLNADYTLSAQTVTLFTVPDAGDTLLADYDALIPGGSHMLVSKATNTCIMPSSTNKFVSISCAGSDNQSLTASPASSGFTLTVKSSGQVLDLLNSATADGTAAVQSAPSGSKGQQWQPVPLDNDPFFELTNGATNGASCLTVLAGSVVLQTCVGTTAQKWQWQ